MLAEYATFLKHGHLAGLAEDSLRANERRSSACGHGRTEAECFAVLTRWWEALLTAFERQAAMAYREQELDRWLVSGQPSVSGSVLDTPEDLLKMLAAEKRALMRPLTEFTSDAKTVIALVEALDAHYQQYADRVLAVMARLQRAERLEHERRQQAHITMLERRNARQDAFASMLSHELRTPLNCILGFSSLLRAQAGLSAEGIEFAGEIDANARRMLRLVNDLLDLARADADKLAIVPAEIDYAALLKGVLASLQPLVAEKRLHVVIEAPSELPVCLDALRISQVLTNLLHNAVKFTPDEGRIRLVASLRDRALLTEICDSGRGFGEDEREALFVPFSQLTGTPVGGTGLGLAITRALVEAHGGRIEAESPGLGQGACFRFTLPV